ncbi:MAG: DUF4147 domain-containing protein [Myxococcota bacterium]
MTPSRGARDALESWFAAALRAVDPAACLAEHVRLDADDAVVLGGRRVEPGGRLFLLALGKAGGSLARGAIDRLGGSIAQGFVLVPDGCAQPLQRCRVFEASHPVPDARGVFATEQLLAWLATIEPSDTLLVLLSGGASSLLCAPAIGLALTDLQAATEMLLRGGASIDELNAVRKHLARATGGRAAAATRAGRVDVFALSDVPGDRLDVLASGPFAPDPRTFAEALDIWDRHASETASQGSAARDLLRAGVDGGHAETPKPGDPCFANVTHTLLANNATAVEAAVAAAEADGFDTRVLPHGLVGEAHEAGRQLASELRAGPGDGPQLVVAGGETTVRVRGTGRGGRSQELALAAALVFDGDAAWSLLAAGTDGIDGPTDAAGAYVDGATVERGRRLGVDAAEALQNNDSYGFFAAEGGLLRTGPTGTNVMDLVLARRDSAR